MRTVIYKFPVNPAGRTEILLPEGGQILSLQVQQGCPCLWIQFNPERIKERRAFLVRETGEVFDPMGHDYVGTFQLANGSHVGHLFEVGAEEEEKDR